MDRGAWWAAVQGVAQSQIRLKRLRRPACIEEGNGNPLQYSCLENPRDRGAWWAAVYGVTQSRTQLKQRSNNNNKEVYVQDSLEEGNMLLLILFLAWCLGSKSDGWSFSNHCEPWGHRLHPKQWPGFLTTWLHRITLVVLWVLFFLSSFLFFFFNSHASPSNILILINWVEINTWYLDRDIKRSPGD